MFDMSTTILHNTFKTTTPLVDATVNETLPLGDYRSLQFFHRVKFFSVIDLLLKAPQTAVGAFSLQGCLGATCQA